MKILIKRHQFYGNQYIAKRVMRKRHLPYHKFIFGFTVIAILIVGYFGWQIKHPYKVDASPLPETIVVVKKITPTPTIDPKWSNVVKLIVDEFEPEGPQVTYQAISVAKNESGWKHNAYNYNTNNTSDRCPFQINDVHIKRFGTKYQTDLKECIRVAHVIYKEQKWTPWVAAKKLGYVK